MARRKNWSAEQIVAKLRQIEVQIAQGKSLALACKEAEISEQRRRWNSSTSGGGHPRRGTTRRLRLRGGLLQSTADPFSPRVSHTQGGRAENGRLTASTKAEDDQEASITIPTARMTG
jgi:hypothetical protein